MVSRCQCAVRLARLAFLQGNLASCLNCSLLAYEIAIAWGCWGLADCRSTELAVPNPAPRREAKAERSAAVVFRVEPNGSSRRLPAAVSVIVGA